MNINRKQHGIAYVALLGLTALIVTIGLAALASSKINLKSAQMTASHQISKVNAHSAIDIILSKMNSDANWRANISTTQWLTDLTLNKGTITATVHNGNDSLYSKSYDDPAYIYIDSKVSNARTRLQLQLQPTITKYPTYQYAFFAGSNIKFSNNARLSIFKSPIMVDGNILGFGTIIADVFANNITTPDHHGSFTKTTITPSPPTDNFIENPPVNATNIPAGSILKNQTISPGTVTTTIHNDQAAYVINMTQDLIIQNVRIKGTLYIKTNGRQLTFKEGILAQPLMPGDPTIIIDGHATFDTYAGEYMLTESGHSNYNPTSTPFQGQADNDQSDMYPSQIEGVLHVKGNLTIDGNLKVIGSLQCSKNIFINGNTTIEYDPNVYSNNTPSFAQTITMTPIPSSYRYITD